MKRIGIATIWSDNYGAVLQGFALQQVLKRFGYESEIIKHYRNPKNIVRQSKLKQLTKMSPAFLFDYFKNYRQRRLWHHGFADFKKNRMSFSSDSFYRDSDFSKLNSKYDAFICGSDMLWSSDFEKDWSFFYLTFVDIHKTISYAPSFGKNAMTKEQLEVIGPMIRRISHLSCREEAGAEFIKNKFDLNAEHVVDPTLLLHANEWNILLDNRPSIHKKPYVLVYTFKGSIHQGRDRIFRQLEQIPNRELLFIMGEEGKYKRNKFKGYFSPAEYVLLFRDADFVVTDTFHGLIFSLIFNKPFIVLDKSRFGVSSDRQISTLKTYGLEDRFVNEDVVIDEQLLKLDYTKINAIIEEKRNSSLHWLEIALHDVLGE